MFLCPAKECKTIEVVTKDAEVNGRYEISEERSQEAPANPVWKHHEYGKYFFNPGTTWMIGDQSDLNGSQYKDIEGIHGCFRLLFSKIITALKSHMTLIYEKIRHDIV